MPVPAGPSAVRVYATEAEYATWLGVEEAPAGAATALIRASRAVDQMLLTAVYDVDDDGLPTDTAHAEALRDATCAQAEYAAAAGDPNLVGAGAPSGAITQVGLGSLSYAKTAAAGIGGTSGLARWSSEAWQILQRAGLTGGGVLGL